LSAAARADPYVKNYLGPVSDRFILAHTIFSFRRNNALCGISLIPGKTENRDVYQDEGGASDGVDDRGREHRLGSVPPPSEPDGRFSRIRLSG